MERKIKYYSRKQLFVDVQSGDFHRHAINAKVLKSLIDRQCEARVELDIKDEKFQELEKSKIKIDAYVSLIDEVGKKRDDLNYNVIEVVALNSIEDDKKKLEEQFVTMIANHSEYKLTHLIADEYDEYEKGWTGVDESKVEMNAANLDNAVMMAKLYGFNGDKMKYDILKEKIQHRLNQSVSSQRGFLVSQNISMDNRRSRLDNEALSFVENIFNKRSVSDNEKNTAIQYVRVFTKEVDRLLSVAEKEGYDSESLHDVAWVNYLENKPKRVEMDPSTYGGMDR